MADDAERYIADGFNVLKVKSVLGKRRGYARIQAIRERVGGSKNPTRCESRMESERSGPCDWQMEDAGLDIELIEQPVLADDIEGLKYVTDHTFTPIMADESVFSTKDALRFFRHVRRI